MSRIKGYPITFNAKSVDLGSFYEIVRSSAVDRMLSDGGNVAALVNHNPDMPLGRSLTGTLKFEKDAVGLGVNIAVDEEVSYVSDVEASHSARPRRWWLVRVRSGVGCVVRGAKRHGAPRGARHARARDQRRRYASGVFGTLGSSSRGSRHRTLPIADSHGKQPRRGQRQPCRGRRATQGSVPHAPGGLAKDGPKRANAARRGSTGAGPLLDDTLRSNKVLFVQHRVSAVGARGRVAVSPRHDATASV